MAGPEREHEKLITVSFTDSDIALPNELAWRLATSSDLKIASTCVASEHLMDPCQNQVLAKLFPSFQKTSLDPRQSTRSLLPSTGSSVVSWRNLLILGQSL